MKTIRWGIIGTGNIANSFARDFPYSSNGELIAVASRSMENGKKFAAKYSIKNSFNSYEALYRDPEIDVVYIATPHSLHFENTNRAIEYGKAVVCEKPITTNPVDCKRLIKLSKSANCYLMEAMWTYFLPPIQKALSWIAAKKIGDVSTLKADFGFQAEYNSTSRLFDPTLAGGALLDIGIYPVALAWLVFQEVPEGMTVSVKKASSGVDIEEKMMFEYKNGAKAELCATFLKNLPNEAIIIGNMGYIRIQDFFMATECLLYDHNDQLQDHFVDKRSSTGYNYEIDAVNQDLLQGKKQSEVVPLSTSLKLQEMMAMVSQNF
jgi:predicted dehydrogenase